MTDYTKVTINVDRRGSALQLSIGCEDDNEAGTGYRLAGPKYLGTSESVLTRELDERDVKEIRYYLAIWDEIQARKAASTDV